jgi:hypothetical protein
VLVPTATANRCPPFENLTSLHYLIRIDLIELSDFDKISNNYILSPNATIIWKPLGWNATA